MKNSNLLNRLLSYSHEKQKPQRFARYAAMLIMLLTLGVGQMWADYYYRGGKNSWGATAMTVHSSGLYEYYSTSAANFNGDQFKISKTTSGYDYNQAYVAKGFNGGVNDIGDYGGDNCYIWSSSNGYIIVYYPNTIINTTSSPKITFRTSLYSPTFYIKHPWGGGSWTWQTMSNNSTTKKYTYTGVYSSGSGANVYTSQSDNNYLTPSGTSDVNNNVPAIWTYNAKNNTLSIAPAYTLTVQDDGHGSASGSVAKGIAMSTKYAISASSPSTGYHFNNWTRVSGGTCTFDNASSASTNVTVTGDASATVQANFALNTYTVVYNANDDEYPGTATGSTDNSSHTYSTAKKLTSNGFSRTGYSFAGWATTPTGSVAYSDGQSVTNLSSTHGATVTLYAKWTENKSTVTLVASPEGKGTFQVGGETVTSTQAGVTTTPSVTAYPISGYRFTGWSISGGASISSTSDNPTTVTGGGAGTAATLTATFEENLVYYDVTFGVGTGYTSLGSISATNNTTSSSISSGDDLLSASSVTFTASPNTGYTVEGWYTNAACTEGKHDAGSTTYTIASLSSDVTVYVKFVEKTWSVAFAAGTGGTVTTPAATPQTVGQLTGISIAATPGTGYTFNTWTITSGSGSFTSAATTNSNTFKPTAASTITASFNETMSSLSTSCHYDAGNPSYAAPTVSGSATNVGYATTRTITATAAGTGYTFAGWTLTNCTRTDGGSLTATSITIRSNGDGAAATVVANYNEVLTQDTWILKGGTNITGDSWSKEHALTKKTGHSTESVVYYTANITSTNAGNDDINTYSFKIVKKGASDTWYGLGSGEGEWWYQRSTKPAEQTMTTSSKNIQICADVAGPYEIKVDYTTPASPKVTVTFPTSYTLTYSIGSVAGTSGSISTSPTTASGSKVLSGTNVTLTGPAAKTGYTWKGWYTNAAGTEGKITDTNRAITVTMNADKTLYACYTINNHTITHSAASHGDYTIKVGSAAAVNTNTTADYNQTITLAEQHATGYHHTGWSVTKSPSGSVTVTNNQFTMPDANVTVAATFTPNTYRVQFHRNGASEATVYQDFTYDVAQNLTANTYTRTGYNFAGWALTADAAVTYADGAEVSNLTNTNNGTFHLYAKWTPMSCTVEFDFDESDTGYGSKTGATTSTTATYAAAMTSVTPSTAANGWAFIGYFDDEDGEGTQYYNADGTSAHAWDKATEDNVTLYAYYKKAEITGITFSPAAVVGTGVKVTATPTIEPTPVEPVIVCYELQYSNGTPLPSQPTFKDEGDNAVSFTAPIASATYILQATLRTGSACDGGTELSVYSTTFQVAGKHDVTVLYKDAEGNTIKASEVIENVDPLDWSGDITAPTITGYTFTKWQQGDGVTINGADGSGEKTSATITIKANYDGTLTAVYTKKRMIYFYNTLNWGSVYVYFYKNDSYWETSGSKRGSGSKTTSTWTDTPYELGKHGQMLPVSEGSNIYYFDAEGEGVPSSYDDVVFTEHDQDDYEFFWKTNAVRRGDYKTTMPMFVPLADQTADVHNETNYYNSGYWMNYPENSGYTLKIYNAWNATKETAAVQSIAFPYSEDLKMPIKMDVELSDGYNHDYWFMVYRNDGTYMGSEYHFKQGYQDEQTITGGDTKNKITTSAPGNYTFILTYHDNGSGTNNYYIDVDFPIASGDYRIYYSDNATWSHGAHTKDSWYHPSHSIGKATTEAKKDTISFFIPKGVGILHTMKFQKASVTNEGVVTWEDVDGGSITIPSSVTTTGVYNFIVSQPAGGASISLEKVELYTGNFYIRTDCAGNTKWDSFKNLDHQMTYSDYAEDNSGYSHYYAHWVESGNNVKFCIANDYSMCITDTLIEDYGTVVADISNVGALNSASASIRFMWNQATNKISRAYISGSSIISDRFLVLEGDAKMFDENGRPLTDEGGGKISGLNDNEINLVDDQNFVYEREIKVQTKARAKLTAKYNNNIQYFIGGADETVELLGGTESETKNKMRIVYDFKTNRLVTAYMPEGEITEDLAIYADLMIVREHQEAGQQLLFNGGSLSEVHTVYGVMRFNRWTLNNKNTTEPHGIVADPKSAYERGLYWISFPFDVNLSDVFGFGTYGTDWILMEYNGAKRATEGYWADSKGFWEYVMPSQRATFVMEAGKGYVLALDLDRMKDNNTDFWTNSIEQVELFFPSASYVSNIAATNVSTTVDPHVCTINRHTQAEKDAGTDTDINKNRTVVDSHWNIIGVPSYANYGKALENDSEEEIEWNKDPETDDLPFLYEWNMVDNTYTPQTGTTYPFKSMHAYIVQYNGTLKWTLASATPATPAPRRYEGALKDVEYRLELQQNEKMVDQAFVKMSNEENVSAGFSFDEDLCKEYNANKANIYTFIEGYIPAAGNTLPMSEQTTVVPVGVKIATNGEYTFAMPEGTDGIGITLVDNETGIRTPLSALDYTVNLSAGTYNKRFVLEISPIHHMPTGIENSEVSHQHSDVRKVLIDGILYIVKDGKMFDARGARVQ